MDTERHYRALEFDKILERLSALTACPDASELVKEMKPATGLFEAREMLGETLDAHGLLAKYGGPSFQGLENVNAKLRFANNGGTLSMGDLLSVGSTLKNLRLLSEWYGKCEETETTLSKYFDRIIPQRFLEEEIFTSILSEDKMADDASSELKRIRRSLINQEKRIREQLDRIIHSAAYSEALQDAIVTMRNGRYVVPVKREHKGEVKGLVQDTSDSGATVFIEPMAVVDANNEIRVLLGKEKEEIERILEELSSQAGSVYEETASSYEMAVHLNVVFAKANLAYAMKATAPVLNDEGIIDLKGARHPLIDPERVVKTDIRLGEDFDTLVITGPNTGGKTVSIKTIGLLSLMAATGMMIPAAEQSSVCVFRKVFADIGDEQSIEQSLSTFSSHMMNLISIIEEADSGSLVLIDELGAGTDPVEGAALAMAILEKLHEKGAKVAATTHYAEIKAYALQGDRIENASCEFDINTLTPTYRLNIGTPGKSNAFAISTRLGMPGDIVERARDCVAEENIRFEDVIEKLEESRMALEKERAETERLRAEAERKEKEAEELKSSIEALKDEEVEKARKKAERIVEHAQRESAFFLHDLDRLKKEQKKTDDLKGLSQKAKRIVREHERKLDDITDPIMELATDENYELPRPLKIGDIVVLSEIGSLGEVTALPDKNGMVEVRAGLLKTTVPISGIRLDENRSASKQNEKNRNSSGKRKRSRRNTDSNINTSVKTEIDLRGMTADEAIMNLDRFLDQQLRCGVGTFTVIHGKGTGVLRKAVNRYLKSAPGVKEYRLGTFGEGEDGVTIVTLK